MSGKQTTILTPFQAKIFPFLTQNKLINQNFYFTGGTALAEFYLHHRLSQDFDFFTRKKFDYQELRISLEAIFQKFKIDSIQYREGLTSKIFFLHRGKKEIIKLEFSYFPFKRLAKGKRSGSLIIDSLLDIAVNKLHALLTRATARDFVDFYFIQKLKPFKLDFLLQHLKRKFLWNIDPLFLASRLATVPKLKDFPKIILPFNEKEFENYFLNLASNLKEKIIQNY